jgi:hypothetical protein
MNSILSFLFEYCFIFCESFGMKNQAFFGWLGVALFGITTGALGGGVNFAADTIPCKGTLSGALTLDFDCTIYQAAFDINKQETTFMIGGVNLPLDYTILTTAKLKGELTQATYDGNSFFNFHDGVSKRAGASYASSTLNPRLHKGPHILTIRSISEQTLGTQFKGYTVHGTLDGKLSQIGSDDESLALHIDF